MGRLIPARFSLKYAPNLWLARESFTHKGTFLPELTSFEVELVEKVTAKRSEAS
jgi:hypothetical protein